MKKIIKSGVYRIVNKITNKFYIGSSKDVEKRFKIHISLLKRGKHINNHLQNAFNIDGYDSFVFEVIEECDSKILLEREQHYLDNHNKSLMYNFSKTAGGGDNISYHPDRNNIIKKQNVAYRKWRDSLSDENKKIISENKRGSKNPNYNNGIAWTKDMREKNAKLSKDRFKTFWKKNRGKTLEEIYGVKKASLMKNKYSDIAKNRIGDKNPFWGKLHTNKYKKEARKRRLGKYFGSQNIPFKIDNIEYKSLGEASKILAIHITTIRHRLNSKNKKFEQYRYLK